MLQGASTHLFKPLVPEAHNSECQNLPYPLMNLANKSQLKLVCGFLFLSPCTNGLIMGYGLIFGKSTNPKRLKLSGRQIGQFMY